MMHALLGQNLLKGFSFSSLEININHLIQDISMQGKVRSSIGETSLERYLVNIAMHTLIKKKFETDRR